MSPGRGARLAEVDADGGAADIFGGGGVVAEPIGRAFEGGDDGAVKAPVEHRCGDGGVAADLAPVVRIIREGEAPNLSSAFGDMLGPVCCRATRLKYAE